MEPAFTHLLQLGILVENVEEAIRHYETEYGIGPWTVIDIGPERFPTMLVDGKPGMLEFRAAFCKAFGLELELMEPRSEGVYSEWVRKFGNGLHHVAVLTRDPFGQVIAEHKARTGRDPYIRAIETSGAVPPEMDFAYLDLRKELGLILEIYNEKRSGGLPFGG